MQTSGVDIAYGRPPRWWQRRSFQRWVWRGFFIVLAPIVLFVLLIVILYARERYRAHQNALKFNPCRTFTAPTDEQIVFEFENGVVTKRLSAPTFVTYWPPAQSYPTVFLHELAEPAPVPRGAARQVVAVEIYPWLQDTYDGRTIVGRKVLCIQASLVNERSPSIGHVVGSTKLVILPGVDDRVRVFAGRVISEGSSGFSFYVEVNGHRQRVDGALRGGVVTLEPRNGETLSPADWRFATFWIPASASDASRRTTHDIAGSAGDPMQTSIAPPPWWNPPTK